MGRLEHLSKVYKKKLLSFEDSGRANSCTTYPFDFVLLLLGRLPTHFRRLVLFLYTLTLESYFNPTNQPNPMTAGVTFISSPQKRSYSDVVTHSLT